MRPTHENAERVHRIGVPPVRIDIIIAIEGVPFERVAWACSRNPRRPRQRQIGRDDLVANERCGRARPNGYMDVFMGFAPIDIAFDLHIILTLFFCIIACFCAVDMPIDLAFI